MAATTWSEYKKYFEKDPALARRFQPVKLEEPSTETAILILRGLKQKYEEAHGVIVRDDAVVAAAELSSRYISGRQLPDKAVDLLDTSAARVKVLLTAKPDLIEDKERTVQALNREKKAMERDRQHGFSVDEERLTDIEGELSALAQQLETLTRQWKKEQELAGGLIRIRKELFEAKEAADDGAEGNHQENNEKIADLEQELAKFKKELEAIQQEKALVRIEVDPDIVAKVVSDWTGIPSIHT
ncbi:type VI secretion system ATPase TssH, partial [Desulfobulbus sp. N3]|nr:type VI secretion system ATPase TssH [Desulfobulbus sp. N3]